MARPVPKPTSETAPFWNACAEGKLIYQFCEACARAQFPPSIICRACGGEPAWKESARRGEVHTVTLVRRAPIEEFRADVPYAIALVDLDEGFRMMMNLRGEAVERAAIGTRVVVTFEDTGQGIVLPQAQIDDPA